MVTFSPLVDDRVSTTKYSSRLGASIDLFILHHTAGGTLASNTRELAVNPKRLASVNYLQNTDGHYRGIVPEEYRAWTSGSGAADRRAITQETINSAGAPGWPVADIQLEETANLIADVARRYGWSRINRSNVVGHREVPAATACPGPYLFPRLDAIVSRAVEIRGGATPKPNPAPAPVPTPASTLIALDGFWGADTTGRMQAVLGRGVDRVVSSQSSHWRSRNPGLGTGWQWVAPDRARGSLLIAHLQRTLAGKGLYDGKIDGLAGPKFFTGMQIALGTATKDTADDVVSAQSRMVYQLQTNLNAGRVF